MEPKGRPFISGKRYLLAFIIGTLLFILIFGISYALSYIELQRISNQQVGLSYDIFNDKLDYSFFNASICSDSALTKLSQDLGFQGSIIDDLEKKLGKQNQDVLLRKKFYSLVEVEHLQFIQSYNAECNQSVNTILFFYSNNASKSTRSDEAGRILDTIVANNQNITVYSFDVDLDSDVISRLEAKYNVTGSEVPVIIVNENTKMLMPANINQIESHFY